MSTKWSPAEMPDQSGRAAVVTGANSGLGCAVAAHPGWAATNLQFNAPPPHERLLMRFVLNPLIAQSEEMGALPILYAATLLGLASGSSIGPDRLGGFRGYPTRVRASANANNPELARRLWQVSEELTGVRYDLPSAKAA